MVERTTRVLLKPWQKRLVWQRSAGLCVLCQQDGKITEGEEYDHVIPLAQGGSNHTDNFQFLCRPCHYNKTSEERKLVVRGSCPHGFPYSAGYRCPKCPPNHKYWQRAERQGLTTPRELPTVDFSGEIAPVERPNLLDRRSHKRWHNRTRYGSRERPA